MDARGQKLEVRGRIASNYIFLETRSQKIPTCKIWAHFVHWVRFQELLHIQNQTLLSPFLKLVKCKSYEVCSIYRLLQAMCSCCNFFAYIWGKKETLFQSFLKHGFQNSAFHWKNLKLSLLLLLLFSYIIIYFSIYSFYEERK